MLLPCSWCGSPHEELVVIRDVAFGEGLVELLDGRGGAGRFSPLVGWWALSSLRGVVLRGRVGICLAGGYVWLRYRLWRRQPKAGDAVRPGVCIFVQVELQPSWPNGVPLAWVVVRGFGGG